MSIKKVQLLIVEESLLIFLPVSRKTTSKTLGKVHRNTSRLNGKRRVEFEQETEFLRSCTGRENDRSKVRFSTQSDCKETDEYLYLKKKRR